MYFSEFLETCTIRWVWICEGGVGVGGTNPEKTPFFNFFYARCRPPHPRRSLYAPQVDTPAPSAPGRTTQHRQQHRPCQNQGGASTRADHAHNRPHTAHTPGRWTRCTGLHSIPDKPRRADRDGGGRWTACAVCPKLCRCGQHDFAIFYQKNKSEKSYIFIQKGLTYKIYLI